MAHLSSNDAAASDRGVLFNKDFVAFLVIVLLSFAVFTGFSYRAILYKSLGVPMAEGEFTISRLALRGLFLMRDGEVFFVTLGVFGALLLIYLRTNASRPLVHYGAMVLMFVGATFGASQVGTYKARDHVKLISTENFGSKAFCFLKEDHGMAPGIAAMITRLTNEQRLKRITESKTFLYLAVENKAGAQNQGGQSIAIPVSSISFCRFVGG